MSLRQTGFPRISIVTPSFNQAQYIGETIESVLSQGYPNLEYIIIDGGSTDGSADIIRGYDKYLSYWVSEKDNGQTHAINKGMSKASGDIRAYINSDDYYLPGAFNSVVEQFRQYPNADVVHGICRFVDESGVKIGEHRGSIDHYAEIVDLWGVWWNKRQYVQPEVFWTRRIAEKVGPFRESLHFVMDYEYWMRILKAGGQVSRLDQEVACFRFTATQKSSHSARVAEELLDVVQPELWDSATPIPRSFRRRLQGYWLFQREFVTAADRAVERNDTRLSRWVALLAIACRRPQLFHVPEFRRRILGALSLGRATNVNR